MVLLFLCSLLFSIPAYAIGDGNIDGGGGGMGQGSSQNKWSPGMDGVRVTVVKAEDGAPVTTPIDLTNKKPNVRYSFGKVSKISYTRGTVLTVDTGVYEYVNPAQALPKIISSESLGASSIEEIKSYFTDEQVLRSIAGLTGMDFDTMVDGEYKLLIEPIGYYTFQGVFIATTATEAALYDEQLGGGLRSKMVSFSHQNLPLAIFLETPDLGYPAWGGSTSSPASNSNIKSSLGIGIVRFNEITTPPEVDILPEVLNAGEDAGVLTEEGAKKLDPSGTLQAGAPLCPPEGDAGTGMVATNAVRQRTGNVSAGTSSFSMIVLEKALSKPYEVIDMVTTPDGSPVAMVHCNNCTSDLNAWVGLFKQYQELLGVPVDMNEVFGKLYNHALEGDADCGGLIAYNYISGEPVTGLAEGRPMFVRSANDHFNLANFMRANLYASVAVLKIGNDVLFKDEKVQVDRITGHGGLFKTKGVGQRILAAAINSPISVMETAGEGGAWGIALLAGYLVNNAEKLSLADYLDQKVFAGNTGVEIAPTAEDVAGFDKYIETYKAGLAIEQAAVANKK